MPPETFGTGRRFPWRAVTAAGVALVLIVGGYLAYAYRGALRQPPSVRAPGTPPPPSAPGPVAPSPSSPPDLKIVDTDGDGLTDEEEVNTSHTDPKNPDTDGDGLFDGEEVKVYHTDPQKPDTDGDGYPDGIEVRNGYNPNGPGRLFAVPAAKP